MFELMGAIMHLPIGVHVLMVAVIVMVIGVGWFSYPGRDPHYAWFAGWRYQIDAELRQVRKHHKRADREEAYRQVFNSLITRLQQETTQGRTFSDLTTMERTAWIYLMTRMRDVLRVY